MCRKISDFTKGSALVGVLIGHPVCDTNLCDVLIELARRSFTYCRVPVGERTRAHEKIERIPDVSDSAKWDSVVAGWILGNRNRNRNRDLEP
jgi:hypothetical protein